MSINFATLQGLTIPEGNVTKITDASGRVLWNYVPTEANVVLRTSCSSDAKSKEVTATFYADISPMPSIPEYTVNPFVVEANGSSYNFTVPANTLVTFDADNDGSITINGENVGGGTYDYVIKQDVTIDMYAKYDVSKGTYGKITITEQ